MLRNGLSDAQETGAADDSYDLSWMHGMPEDSIRAIPVLRELLAEEQDILSRHYMYAQLERLCTGRGTLSRPHSPNTTKTATSTTPRCTPSEVRLPAGAMVGRARHRLVR
jgi:hypothetical protein